MAKTTYVRHTVWPQVMIQKEFSCYIAFSNHMANLALPQSLMSGMYFAFGSFKWTVIRKLLSKYRWVIHFHMLTSLFALTPEPAFSQGKQKEKDKDLKLIVHKPFDMLLLKFKAISSLNSVGADMCVRKYENIREPLGTPKTHANNTLWV